ncbi:MAG TPA: MATE family efflux transporter, partial [bacterium]|nr:MATE family efflux transporter [bacterium]
AYGAGTRVELFALMIPIAFGSTLIPLIGQNWGAEEYDRIRRIRFLAHRFGVIFGLITVILLWPLAPAIARFFSDDPAVIPFLVRFIRIVPIGSGILNVSVYVSMSLNAVGKPVQAALLGFIRAFVFLIPMAWIGAHMFGMTGMYTGLALGPVAAGIIALYFGNRIFARAIAARTMGKKNVNS